jgi:alpha-1,3/alpha-1,6-mannosyltransferase
MYLKTPVIAVNDGGPLESVEDKVTGYLLKQDADLWAEKMKIIYEDESLAKKLG